MVRERLGQEALHKAQSSAEPPFFQRETGHRGRRQPAVKTPKSCDSVCDSLLETCGECWGIEGTVRASLCPVRRAWNGVFRRIP